MSGAGFVHVVPIRYGECDAQGVVFNANYLVYVDDTMDHWVRSGPDVGWTDRWDVMLRRAEIDWRAPLRWPGEVRVRPAVTRWGRTSFDVRFTLTTGTAGDAVEAAVVGITYVSVDPRTGATHETPAEVRDALGPAIG